MPVKMLFEYRFLLLFLRATSTNDILVQTPTHEHFTRNKNKFIPSRAHNGRGERSLLSTGVRLYNRYLLGGEAVEPSRVRERVAAVLWERGVHAD